MSKSVDTDQTEHFNLALHCLLIPTRQNIYHKYFNLSNTLFFYFLFCFLRNMKTC